MALLQVNTFREQASSSLLFLIVIHSGNDLFQIFTAAQTARAVVPM
jgi:hypothetical protein